MSKSKKPASVLNEAIVMERPEPDSRAARSAELTQLDFEYQAALGASGREEKTYGVWGLVWKFLKWKESKRVSHTFHKRTCLWLMLFTGWMGGHRYYQGKRVMDLLYTLFFWTGVPLALCLTDFLEVIPCKADENGLICPA